MNRYHITALIPAADFIHVDSGTSLETHRRTHAAGIPEFSLSEATLHALKISFISPPDPVDPSLPLAGPQNAALRQITAEIRQRYGHCNNVKFKITQQ